MVALRFQGLLLALLVMVCGAGLVRAQKQDLAKDLAVGHWVQVRGALNGGGVFRASEVQVTAPRDEEVLIGTVERLQGKAGFVLLEQVVQVSPKVTWSGVELASLPGRRVKVEGHYRGPHKFSAREIAARDGGRDRIEGRIDRITSSQGELELSIMGFKVRLAGTQPLELDQPLAGLPLAPQRTSEPSPFRRDEEDDLPGSIRLGKRLSLGAQLEWNTSFVTNRDLDDERDDERLDYEPSLRVEMVWAPGSDLLLLARGRINQHWREDARDGKSSSDDIALSEGYLYWRNVFGAPFDLQVGRADFDDPREWLYDENLDTVRLVSAGEHARLELSVSTVLSGGSEREEDTTNAIAYLSNNDQRRHAAVYYIERFEAGGDHNPRHFGARVIGELMPQQRSWLELSWLHGTYEGERVEGVGVDVGTTWSPPELSPWNFTAAFAYGSGDSDPGDGISRTFRQTGLNDNNGKLGGVTAFRYYGEVLDPELANLQILTLGVGVRPTRRNSIDLVAHAYLLDDASDGTFESRLKRQPNGLDAEIGWELDLVYGLRTAAHWSLELVVGAFLPGKAFDDEDIAGLAAFQLRFKL